MSLGAYQNHFREFAEIYNNAINLDIVNFELLSTKTLNDSIFEVQVKIIYNFKLPSSKDGFLKVVENIESIQNIRIIPELEDISIDFNSTYKPNLVFINGLYVEALRMDKKRSRTKA